MIARTLAAATAVGNSELKAEKKVFKTKVVVDAVKQFGAFCFVYWLCAVGNII